MQSPSFLPDPSTLPLREIHLPESVGWWPPAPGWWLLPVLLLLGLAAAWYGRHLYRRRKYSAISMARKELAGIRSRYAADRDAGRCVRSVSGLLRRVSISVFPRSESAGLTGDEWVAFLLSGNRQLASGNIGRSLLEAPYRPQVAHEEVESLIGFCSDWIESVARDSRKVTQ
ncbi:MAG: DUF4381 domain-containing protein [Gammaproteobacteria bacterium]|nr:DUF4381 domain-containing protein [Gammaproteobacteria bacterium]